MEMDKLAEELLKKYLTVQTYNTKGIGFLHLS